MNDFFSNVKKRLSAYFMRIRTQPLVIKFYLPTFLRFL